MREIKFRGQRKDKTEFVYGDIVSHDGIVDIHNQNEKDIKHKTFPFFEVLPETIGQYTGLKDKNGKESFDGDVLEVHGIDYQIKWNDILACFDFEEIGRKFAPCNIVYGHVNGEIIGNIYENSELINTL